MDEDEVPGIVLAGVESARRHLRLAIGPGDRTTYAVRFVFCDEDNRVLSHAHVGPLPAVSSVAECRRVVDNFAGVAASVRGTGLLVAVIRPGPQSITEQDRRWYRTVRRVLAARPTVRPLGVYVVGRSSEREVHIDDAL